MCKWMRVVLSCVDKRVISLYMRGRVRMRICVVQFGFNYRTAFVSTHVARIQGLSGCTIHAHLYPSTLTPDALAFITK